MRDYDLVKLLLESAEIEYETYPLQNIKIHAGLPDMRIFFWFNEDGSQLYAIEAGVDGSVAAD